MGAIQVQGCGPVPKDPFEGMSTLMGDAWILFKDQLVGQVRQGHPASWTITVKTCGWLSEGVSTLSKGSQIHFSGYISLCQESRRRKYKGLLHWNCFIWLVEFLFLFVCHMYTQDGLNIYWNTALHHLYVFRHTKECWLLYMEIVNWCL